MKTFKIPKIQFTWPKANKDSNEPLREQIKPTLKSTQILINGVLFTYILASIISGVVDLVFFSGLSKSFYNIFALSIPASIVMCLLSLVITSGKAWCAIKVEQIKALQNFLKNKGYAWYKNLNKPKRLWGLVHKLCAVTSIITTISLSVVSIGSAVKDSENNTNQITLVLSDLEQLKANQNESKSSYASNTRESKTAKNTALVKAENDAQSGWSVIESYQKERDEIETSELEEEEKTKQIDDLRNKYYKKAPSWMKKSHMDDYTYVDVLKGYQEKYISMNVNSADLNELKDLTASDKEAINEYILGLEGRFKHPTTYEGFEMKEGDYVSFLDKDGNPLSLEQVKGRLTSLKGEWENNSDIGESSKLFMMISDMIVTENSSGTSITSMLIMGIICFFGLLQEALIALLTPKVTIDRKTLFEYESYLPEFDEDDFMYYVYKKYLKKGVISQEDFYYKAEKCKNNKAVPDKLDDFITPVSKPKKERVKKVKAEPVKEEPIEEVFMEEVETPKEAPKETEKPKSQETSKTEEKVVKQEEEKNNKIFVKPAENELAEMLNNKS
jgi:hypothetical protein